MNFYPIDEAAADAPAADDPADSAKATQILDGARKVFLADGFDGASMNDVARVAGVSKGTIYTYFPSKDALFAALIRHDMRRQAERVAAYDENGPAEVVLRRIGLGVMELMLDPAHVAQVRTVTAAAPKFREIGRAFYESGPHFGQERLALWLAKRVGAGELAIDDIEMASAQFFNLCQGTLFKKMLFCAERKPPRPAIEATVEAAVRAFLAAYRPR